MRILVGKTFGIGNAVLAIPMIKALATLGEVDVLIGSTNDDWGAASVMATLWNDGIIKALYTDRVPMDVEYDVAVMAIPFDGRWQSGVHFRAKIVMDGRKRPGNVERLGFDMWEKHEVLYQMENAYEMGYSKDAPVPSSNFMPSIVRNSDNVYLGIGYKRDPGGFGLSKHFGTQRFAALINEVVRLRPTVKFVTTGGAADWVQTIPGIVRELGQGFMDKFRFAHLGLYGSFEFLAGCEAYIGNDTGMMHVAASCGLATCGLFAYPDLITKNPPFCERSKSVLFTSESPSVEELAQQFVDFVWGNT